MVEIFEFYINPELLPADHGLGGRGANYVLPQTMYSWYFWSNTGTTRASREMPGAMSWPKYFGAERRVVFRQ